MLDVVLYTVFRQRRPCLCPASPSGGPLVPVGSIYGMPSGDAMGGALFGMLLVHHGPYHAVLSRALGVLSIVWVCYERAVLGFHSIGQVTAGASIGIALHFYNFFTPQALIVVDVLVMVAAGLPVMFADPAIMHTAPGDLSTLACTPPTRPPPARAYARACADNLFSWYFWGLAIELFTLVCLARFYWSPLRLRDLRFSYRRLMASHEALDAAGLGATDRAAVTTSSSYGTRVLVDGDVEERELDAELDEGSAVLGERARVPRAASLRRMLGTNWMASGAVVMCVVMFLSSCIAQYGWMGWQPQP